MTHTYVLLEVSDAAYEEVRRLLAAKGYDDQFHRNPDDPDRPRINLQGIALVPYRRKSPEDRRLEAAS